MFKVNNKNTKMMSKVNNKNTTANFEHISHLFVVFLLLTLNKYMLAG